MTSFSVRTPLLFWLGGAVLFATLALVVATWGNWLSMFLLTTLFGGLGAALFFMSARIVGDDDGLAIERFGRAVRVRWSEIGKVAAGGGSLVFYTRAGRVTAPSIEFWVGAQKSHLVALLVGKLAERQISFNANSVRASIHVGDR